MACGSVLAAASCLHTTEPPATCTVSTAYVVGDVASDSLTSASCRMGDGTYVNYHSFKADSQINLRITVSSPTNPAIIQIIDSRGAVLANSLLSSLVADTTAVMRVMLGSGPYLIVVRAANAGRTGAYRMVAANDVAPVSGCTPIWVTRGITTAQRLANTDCTTGPYGSKYFYHLYNIVLLNLDQVTFLEHSTSFVPGMVLAYSSGSASSSLDSTGTNASFLYVASFQDLYQLWVGSTDSLQLGTYTLSIH